MFQKKELHTYNTNMVGNVKEGYEGYNSTPSSPTKYTVTRGHQEDIDRRYIVSRLCILLTAVLIILALLTVFLCTYYLAPRRYSCEDSKLSHVAKLFEGQTPTTKTESSSVLPIVFDLTNDQFEIDVLNDNFNDYSTVIPMEKYSPPIDEISSGVNLSTYRLPTDVLPVHYRLNIIPYVDDDNPIVDGLAVITMKCVKPTNEIRFNIKDLDLNDIIVYNKATNKSLTIDQTIANANYEQFIIVLNENLIKNEEYILYIVYKGKVREISNGLYKSYYVNSETKVNNWVVNTLFSPTYARSVYPCFDEPNFKAKFSISIGRSIDKITLSNMNKSRTEKINNMDGWEWDHYQETPVMSTYLTAFLVAPHISLVENKASDVTNPKISLWTRPDGSHQTEFSLRLAEAILKFFENYFEIKFPLSKIDIVGVPAHDYNAMENWGLIIFREGTLLINKGNSIKTQQSLALMLAHELAHQWFGNLVTPAWWDDLWLKEGFSTYFQCLAIDKLKPDWLVFEIFTLNEMDYALQNDALLSSPSVSRKVLRPNKEIFDVITYHKGSSIIQMMANFLEPSTLKSGLKSYLKKYEYSNAEREDLWDSITQQGYRYNGNNITQLSVIMNSWILQPGFPVLTLIRNYVNNTADIYQERFLLNGFKNETQMWWIPVTYTTKEEKDFNNTIPKIWLPAEKTAQLKDMPANDSWVLMNLKNAGYFRVNYDQRNWLMLLKDFANLTSITRAQLISDSLNLARGGHLNYDLALSVASKISNELDYLPWQAATQSFLYIRNSLIKMPAYGNFMKYISIMIWRVYESIKLEDEEIPWRVPNNPIPEMLSENIIGMACLFKYPHCIAGAKELFDMWRKSPEDGNIIPETIRPIIYCTAVREGTSEDWDFIFDKFRKAASKGARFGPEQNSLVTALGCSSEQWLLTKALSLIIQPNSGLTKEEGIQLFRSVAANEIGHWIAVSFIRAEWKQLIEFYNSPFVVYEMVNSIVVYINSVYDVKLLKVLVNEITEYTKDDSLVLKQAVETAQNNINWMEKYYLLVDDWLQMFTSRYGAPSG